MLYNKCTFAIPRIRAQLPAPLALLCLLSFLSSLTRTQHQVLKGFVTRRNIPPPAPAADDGISMREYGSLSSPDARLPPPPPPPPSDVLLMELPAIVETLANEGTCLKPPPPRSLSGASEAPPP